MCVCECSPLLQLQLFAVVCNPHALTLARTRTRTGTGTGRQSESNTEISKLYIARCFKIGFHSILLLSSTCLFRCVYLFCWTRRRPLAFLRRGFATLYFFFDNRLLWISSAMVHTVLDATGVAWEVNLSNNNIHSKYPGVNKKKVPRSDAKTRPNAMGGRRRLTHQHNLPRMVIAAEILKILSIILTVIVIVFLYLATGSAGWYFALWSHWRYFFLRSYWLVFNLQSYFWEI